MRAIFITFLTLVLLKGQCQIVQIPTGTTSNLYDISIIDGNILICGITGGYLVKSTNGCASLSPIAVPASTALATRMHRLDTSNIFFLSYGSSGTHIHRSTNGGYNWISELDTTGQFNTHLGFFDTTEGIVSLNSNFIRTKNSGTSWFAGTLPLVFPDPITVIKTYGDSLVCAGSGPSNGNFYCSKDRGVTWPYVYGFGSQPKDFSWLNKDTIFALALDGNFARSTNGGTNWSYFPTPLAAAYGMKFISKNEGYVVGMDSQSKGIVLRTTTLGQTWQTFNTGVNTALLNLAFLNDSIAFLTGTGGKLLKWNHKASVFTSIKQEDNSLSNIRVFPNPANDKINILCPVSIEITSITLDDMLGKTIKKIDCSAETMNISIGDLSAGVYLLRLSTDKGVQTCKLVKHD